MFSAASRRATAVFGVGFSFVVMMVSGFLLVVAPRGRTAQAIDWQLGGLSRSGWEGVHLTTSVFFILMAAWHLVIHWSVIVNFVTGTPLHPRGHRTEGIAMLVLVGLLLVTAVLDLPPSSWLVDLNEYFKRVYWETGG